MSFIVDRRLNSKNKSAVNRQRFLRRYKGHIEDAVKRAVNERSIQDMDRGEEVTIPAHDISEPVFNHGEGGRRSVVHPGNKEFAAGDRFKRPSGGEGGSGDGEASNSGEGTDDFVFQLSRAEFLDFMFADLELPNMIKQHLKGNDNFKLRHAGYISDGTPAKLSVVRSLMAAKARRIAVSGSSRRRLRECQAELAEDPGTNDIRKKRLEIEEEQLQRKINRVPFLDNNDLRYNLHVKHPVPSSRAVMFCLMDVSGSMDQSIKELAKRYFLLLYLFLEKNYEKTEIVFIRHHTSAKEVDEQEFFYSRESGGTVVSSAINLAIEIAEARYPADQWNIYMAQASDGDNWGDDSPLCRKLLEEKLLPMVQYFTYVEITRRPHQALWKEYQALSEVFPDTFAQRQIMDASDIYPTFRELFKKQVTA